jgi:hypothetical protein
MDIKATRLFLVCLLPLPALAADVVSSGYREYQTPVNYNFFQVSLGGGEINSDDLPNSKVSVSSLNGQLMLNESWLVGVNYKGRFTNNDESDARADYLTGMIGYRMLVEESTDIVVQGRLGYAWVESNYDNVDEVLSEANFTSAINIGAYHGFTDSFEGRFVVEYMDSKLSNETSFELAGDYYFNSHFSFGGYGKYIVASRSDINHFGITAKFRF